MNSSGFRAEARSKMSGKWGKAACIAGAYALISYAISFVERMVPTALASLISLGTIAINIPLAFGLTKAYVKLYNGEDVKAFDFLTLGFNSFQRAWGLTFRMLGKLLIPVILMVVSYLVLIFGAVGASASYYMQSSYSSASAVTSTFSILVICASVLLIISSIWYTIKWYYYALVYIIASEDENLSNKDVVEKSRELMDGKRGKLFILELSFIGWYILSVLSFGIGLLWIAPYLQFAVIAFYKYVSGNAPKKEIVEQPISEE